MSETVIRIIVADDSPFIRTAYRRILETQDNFEVVAIAENGLEAIDRAAELKPDVIVMDVRMPKLDGISASLSIRASLPDTSIVVVSAYDDWSHVSDFIKEDSRGKAYLLKNSLDDVSELIRVVELVNQKYLVLDHALVAKLEEYHARHSDLDTAQLDSQDVSVLSLLAQGYLALDISSRMQMDESDVRETLGFAYKKLDVSASDDVDVQVQATLKFFTLSVSG